MRYLSVHLTDLCNSKCDFCVVDSPLYTTDSIEYDGVTSFLEQNANQGYELVNLHGGEPTIHPRFLDTLRLIKGLGYKAVHLQTNGITLAKSNFTKQLVELNVQLFIISLHGDKAEIQDTQTCTPGGLERTIQGIINVKSNGAKIRTNTVITNQNVSRLAEISYLACRLGVDHINFSNLHPVGGCVFGLGRMLPSFEDIRSHLYPAIDYALSMGRRVTLEGFPHCTVKEKLHLHLSNEHRKIRMLMRGIVIEDYDSFMNDACRQFGPPCKECSASSACGGVYPEYAQAKGWTEFSAI
jgi:MoaA/NifB/PqqE/SkfB family radical SAM enzyme